MPVKSETPAAVRPLEAIVAGLEKVTVILWIIVVLVLFMNYAYTAIYPIDTRTFFFITGMTPSK